MRRRASAVWRGDDAGVSSIELAVIAPSLLLLIFLVIQGALYFYARSVALQSAREGVSQLRLYGQNADDCTGHVDPTRSATTSYANSVGSHALEGVTVTPTCSYGTGGNFTVTVRVQGSAISLIGYTLHVDESATGRVEQFQDNG